MNATDLPQYILDTFPAVETAENFGYQFFFYGADRIRPFASLATADAEYDRFSNLDRPGVYRLNFGIRRASFEALFGTDPLDLADYDFTALDRIMPHPEYSPQFFVCVLNPKTTWPTVEKLLAEAHEIAMNRHARAEKSRDPKAADA